MIESVGNTVGHRTGAVSTPVRRMMEPNEALRLVLESATPLPPQCVPLEEACGLQLAGEIRADRDYPPLPRAMMDGYAVRAADAGKMVVVVGEVTAGQIVETEVTERHCLEIMTGAACPAGTEAVVQKEHVHRDGHRVTLPKAIRVGQHIAPQGSECRTGQLVLGPGETITPLATAVMASFGMEAVPVTPRPSLAVITTGGELVPPHTDPAPQQIRDSNGPMLLAMARSMGLNRLPHLHAEDRLEAILHVLEQVATVNVIVLTGGVSVGTYDLVPLALERYGTELVFHKVRQKPGKPLLLARKDSQLVFGLPGNPLASHLCFHRYVAAAIRGMQHKPPVPAPVSGTLTDPVHPRRGRTFFVPACAQPAAGARQWLIRPLPAVSSADVFASCRANSYVQVPPGGAKIPAGEMLAFQWIGGAPWPN